MHHPILWIPVRYLLALDLPDLPEIVQLEVLPLLRIWVIVPALAPRRLAAALADVAHQHRHGPEMLR